MEPAPGKCKRVAENAKEAEKKAASYQNFFSKELNYFPLKLCSVICKLYMHFSYSKI